MRGLLRLIHRSGRIAEPAPPRRQDALGPDGADAVFGGSIQVRHVDAGQVGNFRIRTAPVVCLPWLSSPAGLRQ